MAKHWLRVLYFALWSAATLLASTNRPVFSGGFQENLGQAPPAIRFLTRTPQYNVAFYGEGRVAYALRSGTSKAAVMEMKLLGSQPGAVAGEARRSSFTALYRGGPSPSEFHLPDYSAVRYREICPGIDWVWHFNRDDLEFDLRLQPGADPGVVAIGFTGANEIWIEANGDLAVETAAGVVRYRRPEAWQPDRGKHSSVPVKFHLEAGILRFVVGPHDSSLPLIIDPTVQFSTYLGGSEWDGAYAVAADAQGNIYVTGATGSYNFPGATGARQEQDVFITKMSPNGASVIFTVILSSTGNDAGYGIALDNGGNIWVAGMAGGPNFPVTSNALYSQSAGGPDAFIARLNPSGSLTYSTYFGGSGTDVATGVALDASGNAYIAGYTSSVNFPTTAGVPQSTYAGGYYDAFLLKIAVSGRLSYATLLGGTGDDVVNAVAVDANGNAWVAGSTDSPSLPVYNAIQTTLGGTTNLLLACLNSSGTAWNVLTYLGGSVADIAYAITLDSSANVYLAGTTISPNFPVTAGAYQTIPHGGYDAFAMKLVPGAGSFVFSTLLGGSANDTAAGMAIDGSGNVWLAGYTASVDFPVAGYPVTTFHGGNDAFLAEISSSGASLSSSMLLGGGLDDRAESLFLMSSGRAVIAGFTGSTDFPTTSGVLQPNSPGPYDAFVTLLGPTPPALVAANPTSGSGNAQTFQFQVSDASGASNITYLETLFVNTNGSRCVIYFYPAANQLELLNDAGTAWLAPVSVGSAATSQNSQCTLNAAGSSVQSSGYILTLNVALSFTPAFNGTKTFYIFGADNSGLALPWTQVGTWSSNISPPALVSANPTSGSGDTQTFQFQVSDAGGASNITYLETLFVNTNGSRCVIYFYPAANQLELLNDAGTAWLTPITIGSAATSQNSSCILNADASSVQSAGSILTLNLALSFTAAFSGTKTFYIFGADNSGLSLPWTQVGTWSSNTNPTLVFANPTSGSGSTQTFEFQVADGVGASNITYLEPLFVNTNGSRCVIYFSPASNQLELLNDAGTNWLTPVSIGSAATLQNSMCTVNAAASSMQAVGSILTLKLVLSFTPAFTGAKTFYIFGADDTGLNLPWTAVGTWSS
jgi:hypothetical protein